MLNYIKKETNVTETENGDISYSTSGSYCLDLFATIGALRHAEAEEIINRFIRAYTEDDNLAMKILFYARDIRGGLGERNTFRTIIEWLAKNKKDSISKNIKYIGEFGRYDDLLFLLDTPCEKDVIMYIKNQLLLDIDALESDDNISLIAKWLPSVNASNKKTIYYGKKIAKALNMQDNTYRKTLSKLRAKIQIIENNLRTKDYSFDYSKQPSRALFKYRKAFLRNDKCRYTNFLNDIESGMTKLNASNIAPYELVENFLNLISFSDDIYKENEMILNATWNSLAPLETNENILAIIDTSGSMYNDYNPMPASVALSLGIYFAENNKGIFKNHFIEFSDVPTLIEIKGEKFTDKLRYISTFNNIANTNLEKVFNLILKTAVKNNLKQDELPTKLIIISDMEFDYCVDNSSKSNFENAKNKFNKKGYKLPEIVFINVASRNNHQPVTMNEEGVILISGTTPRIFSMITKGNFSPYSFMIDVLNKERYSKIVA